MKLAVDLHIHSALSACADKHMTPNNIVNMAVLKGLDIIAVTDHNSAENLEAVHKCAELKGILSVPGMEIETREEVHLICLFPRLEAAFEIQRMVYGALPDMKNRQDIFGQQLVMDQYDNIRWCEERLLLTAANIGIEDIADAVRTVGGALIPAHIDRQSYSILSNLGSVPPELKVKYLEVSKKSGLEHLSERRPELKGYRFIKSSDAHALGEILERESFLELEHRTAECLIRLLQ